MHSVQVQTKTRCKTHIYPGQGTLFNPLLGEIDIEQAANDINGNIDPRNIGLCFESLPHTHTTEIHIVFTSDVP
jgi:hypothetical protein